MTVLIHEVFLDLIDDYRAGRFGAYSEPAAIFYGPGYLERTLSTCILSSNWVYDKARLVAEALVSDFALVSGEAPVPPCEILEAYLRRAGYRYPKTKAQQLSNSLQVLREKREVLKVTSDFSAQRDLRKRVVEDFPGLGLKQASMFLRDAGIAMNLAIVDVHVVWFMRNVEAVDVARLNYREYINIEDRLRVLEGKFSVPIGVLDYIIWNMVRAAKKLRGNLAWETQYALPLEDWTPLSASRY